MSRLNLGDSLILDTDYSESEVKTGATWIDGKPIYRKTINIPSNGFSKSTSGTTVTQTYTETISNIIMQKVEGWFDVNDSSVGKRTFPVGNCIQYSDNSILISDYVEYRQTTGVLYICFEYNKSLLDTRLSMDSARVTIYYTKTTD